MWLNIGFYAAYTHPYVFALRVLVCHLCLDAWVSQIAHATLTQRSNTFAKFAALNELYAALHTSVYLLGWGEFALRPTPAPSYARALSYCVGFPLVDQRLQVKALEQPEPLPYRSLLPSSTPPAPLA